MRWDRTAKQHFPIDAKRTQWFKNRRHKGLGRRINTVEQAVHWLFSSATGQAVHLVYLRFGFGLYGGEQTAFKPVCTNR